MILTIEATNPVREDYIAPLLPFVDLIIVESTVEQHLDFCYRYNPRIVISLNTKMDIPKARQLKITDAMKIEVSTNKVFESRNNKIRLKNSIENNYLLVTDNENEDTGLFLDGIVITRCDSPSMPKTDFGIAQYYYFNQKFDSAIEYYRKVIQAQQNEEYYYSHYMLGKCFEAKEDMDNALAWFFKAYDINPNRAESLYEIAKFYRLQGKNHLACYFAEKASHIPFPTQCSLFVNPDVYNYLIAFELSICCYYTSFRTKGREFCDKVLRAFDVPDRIVKNTKTNLLFYMNCIPQQRLVIIPSLYSDFFPMNPSIVATPDGYLINSRNVNYQLTDQQKAFFPENRDMIITRNVFFRYDKQWNCIFGKEVEDNYSVYFPKIQGMEDMRLFWWNNHLYSLCSCVIQSGSPQIYLVQLGLEGKLLTRHHIDYDHNKFAVQKNWMPIVKDDETLLIIFSHNPLTILEVNKNGEILNRIEKKTNMNVRDMRGGCVIPYQNGYLAIVHEVVATHIRHYLHRFVWYDKDLNLAKLSLPFKFTDRPIEYVCGMVENHDKTGLIIGVGVNDKSSFITHVSPEDIEWFE